MEREPNKERLDLKTLNDFGFNRYIGHIGNITIGNHDTIEFLYSKEDETAKLSLQPLGTNMTVNYYKTEENDKDSVVTFNAEKTITSRKKLKELPKD